jgi:tetratricopeptide (TPR) repeat protein
MINDRIRQLLEFLQEEPSDAFSAYALGLEYLKMNNLPAAEAVLSDLLNRSPEYLAGYYQLGKVYEVLKNREKAIKVYDHGIQLAKAQQNGHTLAELQNARMNLLIDDE